MVVSSAASEASAGSDSKSDARVTVALADALSVEVVSKTLSLVGRGVRTVTERVCQQCGSPPVQVRVEEFGALDYVLAARVEVTLREVVRSCSPVTPVDAVQRTVASPDAPRRSRLYAPANNPRLLAGIETHGADCVLLDLEDSVPAEEKAAARILAKHLLASVTFPHEVWVRINPLVDGGEQDLREVLRGCPHGICLPKAESADDVHDLIKLLSELENELERPIGFTKVMPILETARGVLHSEQIASAGGRVVAIAFGAEDYSRDVGGRRLPHALQFARSMIVAAAAAAGVQASDTVFADLDDEQGLTDECIHARDLGFDGKGAINPRQLGPIHQVFSPTPEELAYAERVVEAARTAAEQGAGAVALDGRMVDKPVLARAEQMIRYSQQLSSRRDRP